MEGDEARLLLGFAPNSRPTSSEVKAAYKKKIWESHPDLFPAHEKPHAESRFKLISEAYTSLLSGNSPDPLYKVLQYVIVCKFLKRVHTGRKNHALIKVPFVFIILGTIALGGLNASRAYKKQKEEYPSHNPFLP
ncbi:Heat shock protein DnaJ, N-terminal [Senna tora]|uniref:Heat shock protein DnaJ, N-terminal n=1 Tax=Senna tora TaxID=362788 RepID=A0A834T9Q9_9FABA|nr:Heat shock protein DnaJ, N-terminal [Senna tora]